MAWQQLTHSEYATTVCFKHGMHDFRGAENAVGFTLELRRLCAIHSCELLTSGHKRSSGTYVPAILTNLSPNEVSALVARVRLMHPDFNPTVEIVFPEKIKNILELTLPPTNSPAISGN